MSLRTVQNRIPPIQSSFRHLPLDLTAALDFGDGAVIDLQKEYADWFGHWLKGEPAPAGDPVKLFVMGENRWITAATYPPPGQPKRYFLGNNFVLRADRGDGRAGSDDYVYDPGDRQAATMLSRIT